MSTKTYDVAGTSSHKGVTKARFANGLETRTKMLQKAGHEDINLHQLPEPMTKEAAAKHLVEKGLVTEGSPEHAALTGKLDSIATKARRAEKRTAVTGEKKAAPKKDAPKKDAKTAPKKSAPKPAAKPSKASAEAQA